MALLIQSPDRLEPSSLKKKICNRNLLTSLPFLFQIIHGLVQDQLFSTEINDTVTTTNKSVRPRRCCVQSKASTTLNSINI